jgi:quinol monooxygenase YgiN
MMNLQIKKKGDSSPLVQPLSGYLTITLLFALSCNLQTKPGGNIAETSVTADSSRTQTFQELGFFGDIKRDKWDSFLVAVQHNIVNSRKEPGNLSFSLYLPENGMPQPIWFERFKTKADHDEHKKQQYFKDAIRIIGQSLESEAHAITLKEITGIPARVPASTEEPRTARYGIRLFAVRPETRQEVLDALATLTRASMQSPGNLECNSYEYADSSNRFVLIDGWKNANNQEANEKQEDIKRARATIESALLSTAINTRLLTKDISQ